VKLPANFRDLIDQQESLEVKRTKILLLIDCDLGSPGNLEDKLLFLQMILASQATIAKDLLRECASLTCENVEWPVEIRA
jgi:hypothetical protein